MKLLSAVAKPTRVATVDNPIVGDTIEVILNDANKLTFEGTNPQVALVNTNFIPFIPGNGDFVINGSNNIFNYGTLPTNTTPCTIPNGTYTRNSLAETIGKSINKQGGSAQADTWGNGLDVKTQIQANLLNIVTMSSPSVAPYFSEQQYWERRFFTGGTVVGIDSLNNAGADTAELAQQLNGSSIPSCKFKMSGLLNGVVNATEFSVAISKGDIDDYIKIGVDTDFETWYLKVGNEDEVGPGFDDGDTFELTINGNEVQLAVQGGGGQFNFGPYTIKDDDWFDVDTTKSMLVTVGVQCRVSNVRTTLKAVEGTGQYGNMNAISNSFVDWASEALEVLIGSGSRTITGTNQRPSVIACSSPAVANNSIGNVLVCLDMECGGHLSGPKTQAVRKFIYTIPLGTANLNPCTVIAPFLLPIDLDLRGYTSISRMSVQFVTQVDDQLVGFTAPASITLAFLE